MTTSSTTSPSFDYTDDLLLAQRVSRQDRAAVEVMMRRYNARLFRVARSVLNDDSESEDALQDAYLDVLRNIGGFRGESRLSTWLTRVVINRALMRRRSQRSRPVLVPFEDESQREFNATRVSERKSESPIRKIQRSEIRRLIEQRLDDLPLNFRTVFVLREVEGLTMTEIAEILEIPEATVRSRLFRARRLLRNALESDIEAVTGDLYEFGGTHCDRIVDWVLAQLPRLGTPTD
ncbi:MAG: RNA polymerase sigma factor [Thermoanaerobaculia bacterium]|nr:RNA polymerase sigma factor [Thermoanaerobaculia bacterium]